MSYMRTQAVVSLKQIKAFWSANHAPPEVEADVTRSPKNGWATAFGSRCRICGPEMGRQESSAKIWRLVKVDEILLKDHPRLYLGFRKWRLNFEVSPWKLWSTTREWRNIASYRLVKRFSLTSKRANLDLLDEMLRWPQDFLRMDDLTTVNDRGQSLLSLFFVTTQTYRASHDWTNRKDSMERNSFLKPWFLCGCQSSVAWST